MKNTDKIQQQIKDPSAQEKKSQTGARNNEQINKHEKNIPEKKLGNKAYNK